jgi:hypothetical protein
MTLPNAKFQVRIPTERLYHVDGTPREAFRPQSPGASDATKQDATLAAALTVLRR